MKRIVSILLLVIFLFNVGGYYLLFVGLHQRADQLLTKKIEANQYGDEAIELKVPISLPYPIQQNGFERVDGKFEHQGTYYKLIKQKFENDTLYVICIPDVQTKRLSETLKDYVAKTNDLPVSSKSLNLFGKFLKDFEAVDTDLFEQGNGWSSEIKFADLTFTPHAAIITHHGPPPKA